MDMDIIASFYLLDDVDDNPGIPWDPIANTSQKVENSNFARGQDYRGSLVVRFSNVPKTKRGFVFGSGKDCDVYLPGHKASAIQFSLTFDDSHRLIIRDWGSSNGTEVTYNNRCKGIRGNFTWIIGGDSMVAQFSNIVITIPTLCKFRCVVQQYNIATPEYISKVAEFKQGTDTTEQLIEKFAFSHLPTEGVQTPATGALYLKKKKLGSGSFGVVYHLWNVSTAEDIVVKVPRPHRKVNVTAWKHEIDIMRGIRHPNIVRLMSEEFNPESPKIYLEYMRGGSLANDDYCDLSTPEVEEIVLQCSSGLKYLHELDPPIAHRDIKLANILVQFRNENGILVKLADFGISRAGRRLETDVGTDVYRAPETYPAAGQERADYDAKADVWSLGVVAYSLLYGLPPEDQSTGVTWCKDLCSDLGEWVTKRPCSLGSMLLERMVVECPVSRSTASECVDAVGAIIQRGGSSSSRSIPAPDGENEATVTDGENHPTVRGVQSTSVRKPTSARSKNISGVATSQHLSSSTEISEQSEDYQEPPVADLHEKVQHGREVSRFYRGYADDFKTNHYGSFLANELKGDDSKNQSKSRAASSHPGSSHQRSSHRASPHRASPHRESPHRESPHRGSPHRRRTQSNRQLIAERKEKRVTRASLTSNPQGKVTCDTVNAEGSHETSKAQMLKATPRRP